MKEEARGSSSSTMKNFGVQIWNQLESEWKEDPIRKYSDIDHVASISAVRPSVRPSVFSFSDCLLPHFHLSQSL